MPRLFESDDYRQRREAIEEEFRHTVDGTLDELRKRAEAQGLALVERGEGGFDFAAAARRAGAFGRRLPPPAQARARDAGRQEPRSAHRSRTDDGGVGPACASARVERVRAARSRTGRGRIAQADAPAGRSLSAPCRHAQSHVEAVFQDVMAHLEPLQAAAHGETDAEGRSRENDVPFHRYEVNLLVDNAASEGRAGAVAGAAVAVASAGQGRACAAAGHDHHRFHVYPRRRAASGQWRLPADRCDGSAAAGRLVGGAEAGAARGAASASKIWPRCSTAARR